MRSSGPGAERLIHGGFIRVARPGPFAAAFPASRAESMDCDHGRRACLLLRLAFLRLLLNRRRILAYSLPRLLCLASFAPWREPIFLARMRQGGKGHHLPPITRAVRPAPLATTFREAHNKKGAVVGPLCVRRISRFELSRPCCPGWPSARTPGRRPR